MDGREGSDTLNGGADVDTVSYRSAPTRAVVNLDLRRPPVGVDSRADHDRVQLFERVIGSNFDDELVGGEEGEEISGGAGDDEIEELAGNDTLRGDDGDDAILPGADDDVAISGAADDRDQLRRARRPGLPLRRPTLRRTTIRVEYPRVGCFPEPGPFRQPAGCDWRGN